MNLAIFVAGLMIAESQGYKLSINVIAFLMGLFFLMDMRFLFKK